MLYFVIRSEFISMSDASVDVYDSFNALMKGVSVRMFDEEYDYLVDFGLTKDDLLDEKNWGKIVAFYYGMYDYWLVRK